MPLTPVNPSTFMIGGAQSSEISADATTITFTAMQSAGAAYIYKDMGIDFIEDFTVRFIMNVTSGGGLCQMSSFGVANSYGDVLDLDTANDGMVMRQFNYLGNTSVWTVVFDPPGAASSYSANTAHTNDIYVTMTRVGTDFTYLLESGSFGGTLIDTDTIMCPTTAYRYLMLGTSYGAGSGTQSLTIRDIESSIGFVYPPGIGDEYIWLCPTLDRPGTLTTTLTDLTENGFTGTLENMDAMTDWVEDTDVDVNGLYALDFDGTDDIVNAGTAMVYSDDWTVSFWMKADATLTTDSTNGAAVVQHRGNAAWGSAAGWRFKVYRDTTNVKIKDSGYDDASADWNEFTDGSTIGVVDDWIHVLIARNDAGASAGDLDLYINGVIFQALAPGMDLDPANSANDLTLGGTETGGVNSEFFKGRIDDVRIFNRFLDLDEIEWLATERGVLGPPPDPGIGGSVFESPIFQSTVIR